MQEFSGAVYMYVHHSKKLGGCSKDSGGV